MPYIITIYTLLIFSFIRLAFTDSATLTIVEPKSLIDALGTSQIDNVLTEYGTIPSGVNIMGQLHYAEPADACSPVNPKGIYFSFQNEIDPTLNPILLVERGNCVFTTKTKYAQLIGAKMVIIINNKEDDNVTSLVFPDNGFGKYLHIPTFVINKKTGDIIKSFLFNEDDDENLQDDIINKENMTTLNQTNITSISNNSMTNQTNTNQRIIIQSNFPKSTLSTQVDLKIWYTPSEKSSLEFFRNWKPYHLQLAPYIQFTPHLVLWYCVSCKLTDWQVADEIDCFSGGRYCAPNPETFRPADGRQVLLEGLRQLCIWNERSVENFWDYLEALPETCGEDKVMNEECHIKVYNKLKWSSNTQDEIEFCVTEGFTGSNYTLDDNTVLKEEEMAFISQNVQYWPAMYIDNKLQDDHDPQVIASVICNKLGNEPNLCIYGLDGQSNSNHGINEHLDWIFISIILALFIIFPIGLYFYRRSLRREMMVQMNYQVAEMVSQYYALSDKNKPAKNTSSTIDAKAP